jgi:DNA-binding MarR family transcriptional regulator
MSRLTRRQLTQQLDRSVRQSIASAILFNQNVAEQAGMNLRDLQVMHLLLLHGPSTPRDLARWASVTTGGMTVILDRLEKNGYLKREANPADRRSCIVHVIPESVRKLDGAYKSKADALTAAIERFSDRELRLLIDFFARINAPEA